MSPLGILLILTVAAVATASARTYADELHSAYKVHAQKARQAVFDHAAALNEKPHDKDLHAALKTVVNEKSQAAIGAWKNYAGETAKQPGAIPHKVTHTTTPAGPKFVVSHAGDDFNDQREDHSNNNGDDHGDDHHGNECDQYRSICGNDGHQCCETFKNATRTVNAAVAMYAIAMNGTCSTWASALDNGVNDGDAAIMALRDTVMVPNVTGTIAPEFFNRGWFIIVSYFNLACSASGSRVTAETFNQVIAIGNRVLFHMYFTLTSPSGSSILLEHVGEARVNLGATAADDRVCGFDVSFTRLGFGLHDAILPAMSGYPAIITSQNNTIVARCALFLSKCPPGPPTNFASTTDCYNYFAALPNGGWDYADQKNRGCAFSLHAQMVSRRPDVHCPHVGPTGGTFCVAHANNDEVSTRDNVWGACHA